MHTLQWVRVSLSVIMRRVCGRSIHNCTCVGFYLCPTVLFVFKVHKYESRIAISPCNPLPHSSLHFSQNAFLYFFWFASDCVCSNTCVALCVCLSVAYSKKQKKKSTETQQNSIKNVWTSTKHTKKRGVLGKKEWEKMASKHVDSVATWW